MLNWDDEIRLSRLEADRARRLAVAPLDEAIAQADLLLAKVRQLNASPERDQLVERILALREERLAIKRERLVQLDHMLPQTGRVVLVCTRYLTSVLDGFVQIVSRGHRNSCDARNALLQPLGAGRTRRRPLGLPVARARGLDVVANVLQRKAASRLFSLCGQRVRPAHAYPLHSRSIASRSRMLAPVGAPPLDC
jgi:hypothetical protein